MEIVNTFITIVTDVLEIHEYTRVGCRVVLEAMTDLETAIKFFINSKLLPEVVPFTDNQKSLKNIDMSYRSEDEDLGSSVHLYTVDRKLDLAGLPNIVKINDVFSGRIVQLDVDRYTLVPTSKNKIIPAEFTEATYKKTTNLLDKWLS